MKSIFFFLLVIVSSHTIIAADYWQQDVRYLIDVALDPAQKSISGGLTLKYKNNSSDTLDFVYFRLAPNGMRPGSPLHQRELDLGTDRFSNADTSDFGLCLIQSLFDGDGEVLNYTLDYSIARVELNHSLLPGEAETFKFNFFTRLPSPELAYRLSFIRNQFKAAHWYPQICVYDRILGWVNNQYIGWGENYGDIGLYEVNITAPPEYIIAASGLLSNRNEVLPDTLRVILDRKNFIKSVIKPDLSFMKSGNPKTWEFIGENICDFAFNADPEFCIDEAEYDGIKVYAYILRRNADNWYDAAEIGRDGIKFFSENFGRYAYPQMTITDSYGGMEYPMLVMCSGRSPYYYLLFWHEIAHNYFMGAVSTNQTDRAFLDEGFTTFLELAAMEHFLGREDNLGRKNDWYSEKFYPFDEDRIYRGFRPYMEPAMQGYTVPMPLNADSAPEWWVYRASSYYKPVCMLFALEYMMGREELFRGIQEYHDNWKFRHPYENDLIDSFEKSTGHELSYFFEQWVYTDKKLDYAINTPRLLENGADKCVYEVWIERKGELIIPVGFEIELESNERLFYWVPLNDNPAPEYADITLPVWDQLRNPQKYYKAVIEVSRKIKSVDIDPQNLLADIYPMNNSIPAPKIQFDWLIERNSPPTHAYQIRHRPAFGYNIIDGFKPGWRFAGSYMEYLHKFDVTAKIGLLNFVPEISFRYDNPLSIIDEQAFFGVGYFDRNGLRGGELEFYWNNKPRYRSAPIGGLSVSFQHRCHYSDDYPVNETLWDSGDDNTLNFNYWQDLVPSGNTRIEIGGSSSFLTNDFAYSKLGGKLTQQLSIGRYFNIDFQLFGGLIRGDEIPLQRLYYTNGIDPEIDRSYEYWGTRSLVPSEESHRLFTRSYPGLYSSSASFTGAESYAAMSLELNLPPKVGKSVWLPFIGRNRPAVQPMVFSNIVFDTEDSFTSGDYILEFGPGILLSGIPGGDFKLAFPLWVDPAPLDEDNYEYRWVVTFTPEFKR